MHMCIWVDGWIDKWINGWLDEQVKDKRIYYKESAHIVTETHQSYDVQGEP